MRLSRILRPALAGTVLLGTFTISAESAHATTCSQLCSGSGACTISGTNTVSPGSVLDCSGRDITINGDLRVDDGTMVLKVRDLLVSNGAQLRARQVSGTGMFGVSVEASRDVTVNGKIEANAPDRAGSISIYAARNFQISDYSTGGVRARGEQSGADGGHIAIEVGGDASIFGPIYADGSAQGESFGGQISLDVTGTITTSLSGKMDATSHLGQGGTINLASQGSVTIGAVIDAQATGQDGFGGDISVVAGSSATINQSLVVAGGAGVSNSLGAGGEIEVRAGCGGIAVNATADATNGGSIRLEADGPVNVNAAALLRSEATNTGGSGGDITIASRSLTGTVTTAAGSKLQAFGDGSGTGGRIEVLGCNLEVGASTTIDARGGKGGSVQFIAISRGSGSGAQGGSLHVSSSAQVKAAGTSPNGETRLSLRRLTAGTCSNGSPPCTFDANCTSGCSTGTCSGENPNTDNVQSQFDTSPIVQNNTTLPECTTVCGGGL